jgi:hypothetical protein
MNSSQFSVMPLALPVPVGASPVEPGSVLVVFPIVVSVSGSGSFTPRHRGQQTHRDQAVTRTSRP